MGWIILRLCRLRWICLCTEHQADSSVSRDCLYCCVACFRMITTYVYALFFYVCFYDLALWYGCDPLFKLIIVILTLFTQHIEAISRLHAMNQYTMLLGQLWLFGLYMPPPPRLGGNFSPWLREIGFNQLSEKPNVASIYLAIPLISLALLFLTFLKSTYCFTLSNSHYITRLFATQAVREQKK